MILEQDTSRELTTQATQMYEAIFQLKSMRQDATGRERDALNAIISQLQAMTDSHTVAMRQPTHPSDL